MLKRSDAFFLIHLEENEACLVFQNLIFHNMDYIMRFESFDYYCYCYYQKNSNSSSLHIRDHQTFTGLGSQHVHSIKVMHILWRKIMHEFEPFKMS